MSHTDKFSTSRKHQRSLKNSVSLSGMGLFTGMKSEIKLRPAPEGTGIVFQRMDLPNKPTLPALAEYVQETPRCTILGTDNFKVQTVEHILSALKAHDIDNLIIEIEGPEIPSCDGSALPFVELIEKAGIVSQSKTKKIHHLETPIFWSKGDVHLVALPSEEFRISYTLNYPNSELLKSQFFTVHVDEETYKEEIASARTFSLYEEVVPLIEKGNIKGGRLDNAVIIKGDSVLNPEGVRYENEMVRHKILDLIGDLALVGQSFIAHVIAIRSGHFSNTSFAKELVNSFKMETHVNV
ncbi:UDP-3-O-acyl-N-acetylglucosamine deacetylase [Candidatus Neptunochlamydia vexilliferae]|uniref:UDP-3-O-acyl-N-acetylglucosamine deacetylase n=1 Tax=Candidatus Neptunichlamydia vexilliferae TaxID=1651774 RepID=A0ABS0AXM4_9BACT|nr:UDP-3-O-acyl-N-acetylglucosamine deacetylase [Candidatus Neptunochlamydia vexilliferae]MBF5058889.1 UDP-3-O-[3-hydroxymyristoyl] N-acetylglucosamine deacetylase [Candidatus Neptunochlamydia vexilliferae]